MDALCACLQPLLSVEYGPTFPCLKPIFLHHSARVTVRLLILPKNMYPEFTSPTGSFMLNARPTYGLILEPSVFTLPSF